MHLIFQHLLVTTDRSLNKKIKRVMKLTAILLLVFSLHVSAHSVAQKISYSGKNVRLEEVFNAIKSQSKYSFFYDYNLIASAKPVTVDAKNESIENILNAVFADQPLAYAIESNVIVIRKKDNLPVKEVIAPPPPDVVVRFKVLNDNGEPLSGAVITLRGSSKVAATNDKGEVELKLSPDEASRGNAIVTFVGFHKYEFALNNKKEFTIRLEKSVNNLNEVVITNAYAPPKRKEEVTGSIVSISNKELQTNRPIESFDKMLEGLAAGVQVVTSTELGTPVKINIRGQNSLSSLNSKNVTQLTTSSQPLFVIDGIPVTEQRKGDEPIAFLNNEQLLNPLAGINPDDIESISILKDAAAASVYGANASNGVVIITTKKGRAGRTRLNVGYSNGWAQSINKIKWLSGSEYYELSKEMYLNDGRSPFDAELLAGTPNINTPWFELVNRYSSYDNVDIDLSGGNANTSFRLSGSYLNQQAIQKGNDFRKLYLRLRLDHAFNSKFSMSISLAPTLTKKNAINVYADVPIIPNVPAYNADGSFFKFSTLGVPNPLAVLDQNVNTHSGGTFNGNISFRYQLLSNLTLTQRAGIDALINRQSLFDSPKNATGESKNGFAQIYDRTTFGWISSTQANWTPKIKSHKFDVLAGFETQEQTVKLLRGSGTGFTYYRLNELSNASSQTSASSYQQSTSISLYGQLGYNFLEKYFATFSGRYDAASIFGDDVNSTVNAAVGLGWLISKEKFLRNVSWLDMLRIRVSYGSTGNSRIGSYQARGLYTFNNTGYNGNVSSSPSSAPNPYLGWEKNFKKNLGIDFSFLKRFSLTIEPYENIVDDAISPIPVNTTTGFSSVLANVGKMRNRGVDASLTAQLFTGKFKWTSTFNAGYNKNVILEIKNKAEQFGESSEGTVLKEGVSTSAIWGFNFAGVDPATGREQYYDRTGKLVSVFDLDRTLATGGSYLGDRLPKLQGGFINSFSYKNFTASVTITYSYGAKVLVSNINENNGRNLNNRNQSVNLSDRWQKPGDVTYIPKLSATSNPLVYTSSKYVYDDTYIKLNNLSISYAVPSKLIRRLKADKMTVYGNAANLFYWYKDKSPAGRNGVREYKYSFPEAQTFTWGVQLSF